MNNQFKLLIYIAMIAGIFFFLQNRFSFLDIELVEEDGIQEEQVVEDEENGKEVVLTSYVEIHTKEGNIVRVNVEVADNDLERRQGLSGRKYLGDYDGMLFVFDERVNSSFWMKDMNFPLDLIFIDTEGFIVDIKTNNAPCSSNYCPNVSSSTMYRYVLEVNSNFVQTNVVAIGDSLQMHLD